MPKRLCIESIQDKVSSEMWPSFPVPTEIIGSSEVELSSSELEEEELSSESSVGAEKPFRANSFAPSMSTFPAVEIGSVLVVEMDGDEKWSDELKYHENMRSGATATS